MDPDRRGANVAFWQGAQHLPVTDIVGQDSWLTGGFLREVKAAEEEWKHNAANTCTYITNKLISLDNAT
jgi:hypothetical protein